MGNLNWEKGVAKGFTDIMNSMAQFEQQKTEMMSKTLQARQSSDRDWFDQKRKMDYAQKLKQQPSREDEALINNVKRQIRFSQNKTWEDQLGTFQKAGIAAKVDFTSDEMQDLIVGRFGEQLEPEANKDNMNIFDWTKNFTTAILNKFSQKPAGREGKAYIDPKNVDMSAVKYLLPQLTNQETLDEFIAQADQQGISPDTINYILEEVNKRK